MKKILKITGISLLSLLLLALIIPYLFKGQIVSYIKKEINNSLMARVDFEDVNISLLRSFPKLSVKLENLYVAGIKEFEKDTLISASSIDASVNLLSLFDANDMKIYGIHLNQPRIHALVNKEGKANWDIMKTDSTSYSKEEKSDGGFKLNLEKYSIRNGYILYKDEASLMSAELVDLNHEGSGDLSSEIFTLATSTNAGSVNFVYEGIPYLAQVKTNINGDISVNNSNSRYEFSTEDIMVNNLKLSAAGFFQLTNDSTYDMDIKFKTPSNEFRDILSLIPVIYQKDFSDLKSSGKASLQGFVKGSYSSQKMPAYQVNLEVKDGSFQYPDLPKPVKNIQLSMNVHNPDGLNDHLVVDIPKGHFEMDNEPFDLRVLFRNPETSKYVDAFLKGRIDLANISQFIKLEKGTSLSGLLSADIFAKGNLSALQEQEGNFNAGGFLEIRKLFYASSSLPQPVQNGNLSINLENSGGVADNTTIKISEAHIELGKDPLDFNLLLSRPVSSMEFSGNLKGRFTLDNIKQFMELDPGTSVTGNLQTDLSFSGNKTAIDHQDYEKIHLAGRVNLDNMKYVSKDYPGGVNISKTELDFTPSNVKLNNMEAEMMGTHLSASGLLNNLLGYVMKDQLLEGRLNLAADKINLNEWMGTDTSTSTATASAQPFQVPANISFILDAKAGQVKYDKVDYKNVRGTLVVKNETVQLQNMAMEALDGTIALSGTYSTKENKMQPGIALTYDVQNIDIQKAFNAYNTVQKLAPVGQYLAGKISSKLSLTGKLGGDMMPDLNSLTGSGNMLLIEGALKKFKPLETLASTLQVNELKEITMKDVKNYIEFTNGKVLIKPFPVKVKDIDMQIGGMHGFDQSLDYIIQMKLPRKYLGEKGNSLVNNLASEASGKGLPVQMGETVNLSIKMGGNISQPSVSTNLKESAGDMTKELKQQATDFARAKMDSTKQTIRDSANNVKKQLADDLKGEFKKQFLAGDSGSKKEAPLQETKKKAEATIKNTVNDLFKKKKSSNNNPE